MEGQVIHSNQESVDTGTASARLPRESLQKGRCPVCGTSIQRGIAVLCTKCGVPHHRDCLEYAGGCAIFGCEASSYRLLGGGKARPTQIGLREGSTAGASGHSSVGRLISFPSTVFLRPMMILMALGACFGLFGVVVLLYKYPIRISDTLIINPLFLVFKLGPMAAGPLALVAAPLVWIGRLFGRAIQRRDMSCWILDVESKTLTKSVKVGSTTLTSTTYDVSAADSIVVGPPVPGADIGLHLTRRGDTAIELANDRRWHEFGYQTEDLLRVGQRLAKALGTKCEEVTELPKSIRGY